MSGRCCDDRHIFHWCMIVGAGLHIARPLGAIHRDAVLACDETVGVRIHFNGRSETRVGTDGCSRDLETGQRSMVVGLEGGYSVLENDAWLVLQPL